MSSDVQTVIVGGGQAGLSVSYHLGQEGHECVVLEQAGQAGEAWRNGRWDSFTLITPNWMTRLPGLHAAPNDPHGFMDRAGLVRLFEEYVARYQLPMQYNTRVTSVTRSGGRYGVQTDSGDYRAANVVMATGSYQRGKVLPFHVDLPGRIHQLHSSEYRNPQKLPPGAVLVVGSGQSGCQIAEKLYQTGRKVYLSVGSTGRVPRRYRGHDILYWVTRIGHLDRRVEDLASPQERFHGNPQLSGRDGGHTINLHQFARDGVTLLGRLRGFDGPKALIAPDLKDSLAKVDRFEAEMLRRIDRYIEKHRLIAPAADVPTLDDGYHAPEVLSLDLDAAGVGTVLWATGYTFDYGLVQLPILDSDRYPRQQRGVTEYPGLYFVGLNWLHTAKSGLLYGVGEDAAWVASRIALSSGGRAE